MILFRYLFREIYGYMLAITLVLLLIFITNQFDRYLKSAAAGVISMGAVMKIMALQVPLLLGYLLPLGFYLAILLSFGRLYSDNEMTIFSACGISRAKIMGIVLIFAAILAVIIAWLMLWAEPIIEQFQERIINGSATSASIARIIPQRFQPLGKNGVLYADSVNNHHQSLNQVFFAMQIPSKTHGNAWDITVAEHATDNDKSNQYLEFLNGNRYVGKAGDNAFQNMQFKKYGLDSAQPISYYHDYPNNVPTLDLLRIMKTNGAAAGAIHWRIAMPITVFIFALLAVPLSQVNPRFGKYAKLFPAIVLYTVYADLIFLGRAWITGGKVSPMLGLWWLHGAFLIFALLLNLHYFGWRRFARIFLRSRSYAHS